MKPRPKRRPRVTRRTVKAGLAALTAGVVVFGSAAGPAFAGLSAGPASGGMGASSGAGTAAGRGASHGKAGAGSASSTGGAGASSDTGAANRPATTKRAAAGSATAGSGAGRSATSGTPVEQPDFVADDAQTTTGESRSTSAHGASPTTNTARGSSAANATSGDATHCKDVGTERDQNQARPGTTATDTHCDDATTGKTDGWGLLGGTDPNGGWGADHGQDSGTASTGTAAASGATSTNGATATSSGASTGTAGTDSAAGARRGATATSTTTAAGTTGATSASNGANTGTAGTDSAAGAQRGAAATAGARAWAQIQRRAAASGRPYANADSDALDTDKRGAGRDTDALRAVPSVIARWLAATAGGAASGSDTNDPSGAGHSRNAADLDSTGSGATDRTGTAGTGTAGTGTTGPGSAGAGGGATGDPAPGTGVYVPGVSAPGFGARIEATPEAPSHVTAEPLASGIRVSWQHSGTDVDHYSATAYDSDANPAGSCLGGDASTMTCDIVNGITLGATYTVTVVALGSADESEPSAGATSGAVVPGPPGAPTGVRAVGQSPTSLSVLWAAPSTPSSGIDHYVVVSDQDASKGCTTNDATTLHCVVDTLSADTAYTFTVQSIGSGEIGDSAASESSDPVTPGAPDSPTAVTATQAGANTLRISWTAPATTRGGIASYVATAVEDPSKTCDTTDGGSTYCEIDGLQAGGAGYTFTVVAKGMNESGDSDPSAASSPAVVAGPPGAPTGVTVTPGDGELTVHWTAPVNPGAGLDGYEVWTVEDHTKTCGPVAGTADHCTISGLINGTAYHVQVRAIGSGNSGDSDWVPASAATPSRAPQAPGSVTATARVEAIWVSWVAGDPGSGVTKFHATVSSGANANSDSGTMKSCEAAATETGCAITGLTVGTEYQVMVQALGTYGRDSAWSTAATATPTAAPALPADVPPSAGKVDNSSGTDVAPGEQITLSGTGYQPHSTITVAIYSTPLTLATTTTDGSGAFSIAVTVPAGYTGTHTLVASGVDNSGQPRYLTLGIDIAVQHVIGGDHTSGDDTGTGSGPSGGSGSTLAVTGGPISSIAMFGLCLVLAGFAFVTLSRLRFAADGSSQRNDRAA
ncbi:fibronectin type III domain-containing protein [Dactylosporangium sp. CA-233914]|uniref:fibronectin type III domain-containing protein n=1 Tax=Dactylosporangium sp. CA-233914 TaxID=3239934 RepID=UPI003D8E660D